MTQKYVFKTPEPCSVQVWSVGDTEAEATDKAITYLSEIGVGDFDPTDLLILSVSKMDLTKVS